MALTPMDIHNKEFSKGFRGYRETEVDDFLDEVVREFESHIKQTAALQEQMEKAQEELERYRNIEDTLNRTMVVAQKTADEVRENARREAELIVREAEQRAKEIILSAERRVEDSRRELEETVRQASLFRAKLRGMLRAQMDALEDDKLPEGPAGSAPGAGVRPEAGMRSESSAEDQEADSHE